MISTNLTVIDPPVSLDLTTLDVLREELGLSDHKSDSRLARWIHDASAQVVDYLGRDLAQQTVSEVFYMPRHGERVSHKLVLKNWPVVSVTSIAIDGIAWDPDFYGGPEVQAFEREWEQAFRTKHAVTVNSATSGLDRKSVV